MKARLQRRKLRAKRKGTTDKGKSYISGAFDLSKTPKLLHHLGDADEPEIKFIDETDRK